MDDLKRNYMLQRSSLEHHLLPDLVFDDTKRIVGALATKREEVLFLLYDQVMPGRFKKEQFKVTPGPNKMGGISIIMRLPDPDVPLACPFIGISCGEDGSSPEYYTIERTIDGDFLLCTKPDKGSHAVLAEDCGSTPKEHAIALMKHLNIGLPER